MKKIIPLKMLLIIYFGIVSSSLAEDIRDVKPPVPLPQNYLIWLIPIVIMVAFGVVWLIWRFISRKAAARKYVEPMRSPWEIAYERLRQLKSENFPARGLIKEYYSRLSDIVRRYIENRFDIRAPEMTTEEFLISLKFSDKLTAQQKGALQEFLTCCDMVKFARYDSNEQEMEKSFVLAERLVDETKEILRKVEDA